MNVGSSSIGGLNTIRVDNGGGLATLNFANSGSGFSTRPGTRAVYRYEAASGTLGALASDSSGSRVTFAGTPFLGANGLLSTTSVGSAVGFATVKDSNGVNFATYTSTRGIISAADTNSGQTVKTVTNASGLQGLTASSIGQLNIAASTTLSPMSVTSGTLRITPAGSGGVLALGSSALTTNAVMLNGANDFTISGMGNLTGTGVNTAYIYVNDSSATLGTSLVVANGGVATVFAGPGFVNLTGTGSQNTLTSTSRFVIAGGVVRASGAQVGFGAAGASGIISLSGGVLEIKGGSNGAGTSADFARGLGASAGNVTWGGATANEVGGGGFSAFGSAASVNIGGAATPTALQWNAANFVGDGYALKFGSAKSDSQLVFLNPINLENGAAYQLREINVAKGVGGDRTVIASTISGSSGAADLLKTGDGILVLNGTNTYAGNTIVQGGTLLAGRPAQSFGDGTGLVIIGSGATVGGDGSTQGISNAVVVNAGGTLRGDTGDGVGNLNILKGATFADGASLLSAVNGTTASRIDVSGAFGRDSTAGVLNIKLTNAASGGLTLNGTQVSRQIATYGSLSNLSEGTYLSTDSNNPFIVTGTNFNPGNWTVVVGATSLDVTFSPTPVPEPGTLFAVGAAGLALVGGLRRWRGRHAPVR